MNSGPHLKDLTPGFFNSMHLCFGCFEAQSQINWRSKTQWFQHGASHLQKDCLDFFWQLFLKELYYKCTKVIGHGKINPRSWEVRPHLTGISPTPGQLWLHHDSCESPSQFPICRLPGVPRTSSGRVFPEAQELI